MLIVLVLYLSYVGLNSFFSDFIIRKISHPIYSLPIISDEYSNYSAMVLFFGLFLLLFRKRLRWKRMKEYYQYVSERKDFLDYGVLNNTLFDLDIKKKELESLERKIKLEELKRKIKRRKILSFK